VVSIFARYSQWSLAAHFQLCNCLLQAEDMSIQLSRAALMSAAVMQGQQPGHMPVPWVVCLGGRALPTCAVRCTAPGGPDKGSPGCHCHDAHPCSHHYRCTCGDFPMPPPPHASAAGSVHAALKVFW
jgi:hypothetical protein